MSMYDDPAGWAKQVAGSKLRVAFYTFLHLIFTGGTLYVADKYSLKGVWVTIIFAGVLMPYLYLCALHLLLKKINSK